MRVLTLCKFTTACQTACAAALVISLPGTVLSTAAMAADAIPQPETQSISPVLDPVLPGNWSGAYGGLYGGLKWQSVGVMGGDDVSLDHHKEIGGYVGINQELGNSVVGGLEWMGGFSGQTEREDGIRVEQDWETSLRARMGFAVEQNLVYGLAGVSATRLEASEGGETDQQWLTGWTVGAGLERKFTENISGRVEYGYTDYGTKRFDLGTGNPEIGLTGHGLKLGVGVNF